MCVQKAESVLSSSLQPITYSTTTPVIIHHTTAQRATELDARERRVDVCVDTSAYLGPLRLWLDSSPSASFTATDRTTGVPLATRFTRVR